MAPNQDQVKLFGMKGNTFVTMVDIALNLKGIEYEYAVEKLGDYSETLINYNPVYKKVPVLVHNEKPISESLVILEYIDETWKQNPILPSDPYKRALARFWSNFIDDKCLGSVRKVSSSVDEKERGEGFKEIEVALGFLEDELKEKYFGGEEIGIVDITAVFISFWFPVIEEAAGFKLFTRDKFPKLYKWSEDFNNHPIVKEQLPPREILLAFFKARFESLGASK